MSKTHNIKVSVRGQKYPVFMTGKGIPCLLFGTAKLVEKSLSDRFKKSFQIYGSDLYWDLGHALDQPQEMTMKQIVDDLAELIINLGLPKVVLFGFSAFGIVALEFAKHYSSLLQGVIIVGTPPNSNQEIANKNEAYFQAHADEKRKQVDKERRAKPIKEIDPFTTFLKEYTWRDAPRYWHNPTFDCSPLWEGTQLDMSLVNHFFSTILPQHHTDQNLEKISCPVFLGAGIDDYDCCPHPLWSQVQNRPLSMTLTLFQKSGHWLQYEEPTLFDEKIEAWAIKSGFRVSC